MSTKIITMNRGDTYKFNLNITDDDGNKYKIRDEDVVYFGVMRPFQKFEDALIRKRYTVADLDPEDPNSVILVTIKPEDTIDLVPGTYYYSVKLHLQSKELKIDDVVTIINKTKLILND